MLLQLLAAVAVTHLLVCLGVAVSLLLLSLACCAVTAAAAAALHACGPCIWWDTFTVRLRPCWSGSIICEWVSGYCAERHESVVCRMAVADKRGRLNMLCCAARQVQSAVSVLPHSCRVWGVTYVWRAFRQLVRPVCTLSSKLLPAQGERLHGLAWDGAVFSYGLWWCRQGALYIPRWAYA